MRQIFSSQRLENVEGVAKLLEDEGIALKITDGRSWKGNSRRDFSYNHAGKNEITMPAVWVLKPDDFKRAREVLHDNGLLDDTRDESYLPPALQFKEQKPSTDSKLLRIKMALLFFMVAAASVTLLKMVVRG